MNHIDKRRIEWIDYLKAIGMFYVIIGHVFVPPVLKNYIYSFHMPLFFICTGMTFNSDKFNSFKELLKYKMKNMFLPYFMLNICALPVYITKYEESINGIKSILKLIVGIMYSNNDYMPLLNGPTWFITTLILVELLLYLIYKYIGKEQSKIIISASILLVFGYCESIVANDIYMPWHINSVPVAVFFALVGNIIIRVIREKNINKEDIKYITIIILLIVGYIVGLKNGKVSFGGNKYKSLIVTLTSSLSTCMALILLCIKINKSKILSYIGKNTLIYLGLHKQLIIILNIINPMINENYNYAILSGIFVFIIIYPISYIINKYIPFIIGNFNKNKTNLGIMTIYIIYVIYLIMIKLA